MKIYQSNTFKKSVKKLHKKEKSYLDDAVRAILDNPTIGVEKQGDLKGIYIYEFDIIKMLYLLSYRFSDAELELISLGSHENYYKELKLYLKNR